MCWQEARVFDWFTVQKLVPLTLSRCATVDFPAMRSCVYVAGKHAHDSRSVCIDIASRFCCDTAKVESQLYIHRLSGQVGILKSFEYLDRISRCRHD